MKKILLSLPALFILINASAQDFTRKEMQANLAQIVKTNGVAVADYDQDGDLDIFFTGIKNFNPADETTWNHLMKNNGDGTFSDVTVEAGFDIQYINEGLKAERGEKMGASWGDYDNDGYPDLFMANSRLDQLYHNNGDGTFTDVTVQAGVAGCNVCYSATGLWWDHDRDGDLDLYVSVLNNDNFMYQNNGDGTFTNITEATGLAGGKKITWSSVAIDAGKDGFLDLYTMNDTQANDFFENRSGQKYNEAGLAYRIADEGAGMGVAVGDCNNDGLFDIYVTNIYNHHPNPLFMDTGNRRYTNKAKEYGVENTGWGWGTHFLDFDHDGDEDLSAVNGPIDKLFGDEQPDIDNFFFKNMLLEEGSMRFEDISQASGFVGKAKSKGLEVFDYDLDGDLDLVVANMEEAAYFFNNNTILNDHQPASKNWLQIKLEGTASNRDAFGTTVKIRMGEKWLHRYHHGANIFGQSIRPVHFGVGGVQVIDEIRFTWLTGVTEAIYDVPVNQILHFREGNGTVVEEDNGTGQPGSAIVENAIAKPNPFFNETLLQFELAKPGTLDLKIFTPMGKLVYQTTEEIAEPGILEIPWGAEGFTSGVYFYVGKMGSSTFMGRLVKVGE